MIESEKEPKFTQAMAAAFFDLRPEAFREKEKLGLFVSVDGEDLTPKRVGGEKGIKQTDSGGYKHRRYSLYDIRRIAHALRMQNKMSDRQLRIVLMRIDAFSEPLQIKNRKKMFRNFRSRNGW